MIAGNIYGVVLNDRDELNALGVALEAKPYAAPPKAAVVYQKPLGSIARGPVPVPPGGLVAATTVALLFARDATRVLPEDVAAHLGGAALAVDLFTPNPSYYRPSVANRNADGRLLLGAFGRPLLPDAITMAVDGTIVHEWALSRLVRDAGQLVSDLSQYMTLMAGDLLLIGLAGDAPAIAADVALTISCDTLPAITTTTVREPA